MWKAFFTSKKAVAAIVGSAVTIFAPTLHLSDVALDAIQKLVMVYIGAQGVADFGKGAKAAATTPQ